MGSLVGVYNGWEAVETGTDENVLTISTMPNYLVAADWMEPVILTLLNIGYAGLHEVHSSKAVVIHKNEWGAVHSFQV